MTKKTPYQKFVILNLYNFFKTNSRAFLNQPGIKNKIIGPMVRHYPEITSTGNTTYQNIHLYRIHFRWSVNATLPNFPTSHKQVHTEHIVPVGDCMRRLFALPVNFTLREMVKVFDDYEIVNIFPKVQIPKGQKILVNGQTYTVDDLIVKQNHNFNLIIDNKYEQMIISHAEENVIRRAGFISTGTKLQRMIAGGITLYPPYINNHL